jgi:hypothetical protein
VAISAPFQQDRTAYQDFHDRLSPTALQGPVGTAFESAYGAMKDALVARLAASVKAKFPGIAPADALAAIGAERLMDRGPGETDAAYAIRLQNAWNTWPLAGTPRGLLRALYDAGYPNTAIVQQLGTTYQLDPGTTNYVLSSRQFSNAVWTKGNTTVVDNFAIAPDGSLTAAKLTDTAVLATHRILQQTASATASFGTASIYAKAGTVSFVALSDTGPSHIAVFDLSAGTIPTITGANTSATITALGNGWYRCTMTHPTLVVNDFIAVNMGDTAAHANPSGGTYTGGAGTIFIWDAQLEPQPFATTDTPTQAVAVTRAADPTVLVQLGSPRWHFDVQSPLSNPTVWASATYGRNAAVVPSPANGFFYETVNGGTTGATQPTFPTTLGATVQDGSVTWCCRGRDFWSRFAVVFFTPFPVGWGGTPPAYASQEVVRIRNLINQWKAAHSTCVEAVAEQTGNLLGYPAPLRALGSANGVLGATTTLWAPI